MPMNLKGNTMKTMVALLLCLFLASCANPVFFPDHNSKRLTDSNTTRLERVTKDDSSRNRELGVAVMVGIDEGRGNYIALAPAVHNQTDLKSVNHSLIRTLSPEQAKEMLRAVDYAIKNFKVKVSDLESINANFQSALSAESYEFQGNRLAPIIRERLIFTFANVGWRADAKIIFEGEQPYRFEKDLDIEDLELLSSLMNMAIAKIGK